MDIYLLEGLWLLCRVEDIRKESIEVEHNLRKSQEDEWFLTLLLLQV